MSSPDRGIGAEHTMSEYFQLNESLTISTSFSTEDCEQLGWFPTGFGLKDHSVFIFDSTYYIASIRTPDESEFVYARSNDLCHWEDLGTVISERIPGEWDEAAVWAPYVFQENGTYFMYYTGVRNDFTQSIMLAKSTNPADPDSWQRQGLIFQPDHRGSLWQAGRWSDCRDATVLRFGDIYYMVYTGLDDTGGIVGLATSYAPTGPWHDWGMILSLSQPGAMAESPTITRYAGVYYLLYHDTYRGQEYRIGPTFAGPWSDAYALPPGWANEVWMGQDGLDYTSYLQGYAVLIDRFLWDDFYTPPRIFIGDSIHRFFIPHLLNQ